MPLLQNDVMTILHFNDCYNVEGQNTEPIGGAARFSTALESFSSLDPITLFSGDILAPSIMSTFTKGKQMVPVLKAFKIDCAVFGNHDFDFGVDNLMDVVKETPFPWLLSNVLDNNTNQSLADGKLFHVIERKNGRKIGLIGLVEQEWLVTLATIDPEEVTYVDYVEEGRKLARMLKDQGCDFVIALTHMRMPNDVRLAESVDDIDLILGGHDHVFEVTKINGKYIVKSGTDFRQFSKLTIDFDNEEFTVDIEEINVTGEYAEDLDLKEKLKEYVESVQDRMDDILGHFSIDLDGRFSSIRSTETNLGNFICDIMLSSTHSDLAILNSGTLRSDKIQPEGDFKVRDLLNILPMMDPLIVLEASGKTVLEALENGVSQYPKLEGRFPQVAGVTFTFDPAKPPGNRIDPRYVRIGDEYLDFDQNYRLVTKAYLYEGKDGYGCLKSCEVLVSDEESPELCTSVQNHFTAIKMLSGITKSRSGHRQSLVCLSRRSSLVKLIESEHHSFHPGHSHLQAHMQTSGSSSIAQMRNRGGSLDITAKRQMMMSRQPTVEDVEKEQCKLSPKVDGRIQLLKKESQMDCMM